MRNDRSRLRVRVVLAALSVIFLPAYEGQAAALKLDYERIITCNVAVEGHYISLNIASIKLRDGKMADIQREEIDQRGKWLSLATAGGRRLEDVESDLRAAWLKLTADNNQAEWDILQDLYIKSEPSLKLMPYYKPLPAKEREYVKKRRDGIIEVANQKNESQYRKCLSDIQ